MHFVGKEKLSLYLLTFFTWRVCKLNWQKTDNKKKYRCFYVGIRCCWVASVVSDSVRPHRRQPTRLPHPWDPPGKNTGVGCHFLLQCMKAKSESKVAQSCPTLRDPMDLQPTRLLHPWDFPGKSTGVGGHCLLWCGCIGIHRKTWLKKVVGTWNFYSILIRKRSWGNALMGKNDF